MSSRKRHLPWPNTNCHVCGALTNHKCKDCGIAVCIFCNFLRVSLMDIRPIYGVQCSDCGENISPES